MPELPDISVYVESLAAKLAGATLQRVRVMNPFVLRTASKITVPITDTSYPFSVDTACRNRESTKMSKRGASRSPSENSFGITRS